MRIQTTMAWACLTAVALAACGGDDDADAPSVTATQPPAATDANAAPTTATGTTPDEPAATAPATTPAGKPSDVECPAPGEYDASGTFTFLYTTGTTSFDPDRIRAASDQIYLLPLYDSLLYDDANGNLHPMLAESYEVSPDGATITMQLRTDWQFHDGTPFNAEAVKANIERHQTLDGSFNAAALANITEVEVLGEHEVAIHVNGGVVATLASLGGPAGMMMSPAVFDDESQLLKPTGGSGAFRLAEYVDGVRARFERVENYWDPNAYGFDTMEIEIVGDDNARLNAMLTGAADATFLRPNMMEAAENGGLTVCYKPTLSAHAISFNTTRSEFGDVKVRQALNHAIDREAIGDVLFNGMCVANSQRFPTWFYGSNPDLGQDFFDYDPDKARALLEEAGLADGFSFELHTPADAGNYMQIAEVVQQQLAEIGVTVEIVPSEIHSILEGFRTEQSIDAHLAPLAVSEISSYLGSFYLADGINNPGGYEAPGIADAFAAIDAATSTEEQAPYFAQIAETIAAEAYPQVMICNNSYAYAMGEGVGGLEIFYSNARQFRTATAD